MKVVPWKDVEGGPLTLVREIRSDNRGSFEMLFQKEVLANFGITRFAFNQVNLIRSGIYSLRGFHGSEFENNHWKIITVVKGSVIEAALDLRNSSKDYSSVMWKIVKAKDKNSIVIPPGFAHGFQALEKNTQIIYATNIEYSQNSEFEISPINELDDYFWRKDPILSNRDLNAPNFSKWHERKKFDIRVNKQ